MSFLLNKFLLVREYIFFSGIQTNFILFFLFPENNCLVRQLILTDYLVAGHINIVDTVIDISEGADTTAFPNVDGLMDKADLQELINPNTCVVVCTQGENDEQALE